MAIQPLVFYCFAALLIFAGLMVITARNPVRAVLFLILAFFASSVLWMLLQAEFLALVLIFVYVGAVMTLFLFVVMMLNIKEAPKREGFVRYFPFGVIIMAVLVGLMIYAILPKHFALTGASIVQQPATYSNIKALGALLYTHDLLAFEVAAVLLLVAIIAAITLAHRGAQARKQLKIEAQIAVKAKDRLRIVSMKAEKS